MNVPSREQRRPLAGSPGCEFRRFDDHEETVMRRTTRGIAIALVCFGLAAAVAFGKDKADGTAAGKTGKAEKAMDQAPGQKLELYSVAQGGIIMSEKVVKSDAEWK